jgi:hypothetical protein
MHSWNIASTLHGYLHIPRNRDRSLIITCIKRYGIISVDFYRVLFIVEIKVSSILVEQPAKLSSEGGGSMEREEKRDRIEAKQGNTIAGIVL